VSTGASANANAGATWAEQISTLPPTPPCFGAAARDPEHPCNASALADTVTPTYTWFVSHGIFATFGAEYIDHPKVTRAPGEHSAYQFLTVLFYSF